jgi:hypothetical protein
MNEAFLGRSRLGGDARGRDSGVRQKLAEGMTVDAASLFLARCKQIETAMATTNEIELLDLSAYLRQLLIDETSPLHQLNRERRLKLKFVVGQFRQQPDGHTQILSLEDGVDPEIRRQGSPRKEVSLGGFLDHTIVYLQGQPRSVGDVIKFAANVAGGVHQATPRNKQKLIHQYSSQFSIGGLPGAIRQLQAIARVALRGLRPLIEAVENR